MKEFSVRVPVIISVGDKHSRPFEHSLLLKVKARGQKDALTKVQAALAKQVNTTA
jgi:hypothetical protein